MNRIAKERLPIVILAIFTLVTAVLSGLARFGIELPTFFLNVTALHGSLMVYGFFGTVIGLERAIASRDSWAFLAPIACVISSLLIFVGVQPHFAYIGFMLAGVFFASTTLLITVKQPAAYTFTLLVGAVFWPIGFLLMAATNNQGAIVVCGIAFLSLTIAGERLELTRFLPPSKYGKYLFLAVCLVIIVATLLTAIGEHKYELYLGLGYSGLAIWMFVFDIARQAIKRDGITRFVAICLLCGYVWLLVGGLLWIVQLTDTSFQRDSAIHAITLGFIFSMVIGHAPIIFPAVMRIKIPYSPLFYLPLAVLNFGVLIRIIGGVSNKFSLLTTGAIINSIAIATFLLVLVAQLLRGNLLNRG